MNRPGFNYHQQRTTFDARDRALSLETFDADGNPALDQGTYGQRYTYDDRGNVVAFENLLPEGPSDSWARMTRTFDAFGRMVGTRGYDVDGRLAAYSADGTPPLAGWDARYDASGRIVSLGIVGEESEPLPCPAGFSEVALTWQDEDRALVVEYCHEGQPVVLVDGESHRWWGKRADSPAAVAPMWQEGGVLARELRGVAGLRVELDLHGRVVAVRFLGPDGGPMVADGVAGFTQTWNEAGRQTQTRWVDEAGATATHQALGWATQDFVYQPDGKETKEILRDAEGQLR